jgi:nucleotide-binding universal stress UspA family protein
MLRIDKILLPVDFSQRSPDAARYAKLIACRFSSELTMLHVVPPIDYVIGGMEESAPWAQDWRLKRVDDATSRLARFLPDEFGKIPVSRIVVDGDPAREIVRIASREEISLIVLPTHGYGPFRKFVLGSVTAKVLDEADCPVLTGVHIAEAAPEAIHFNSVVCAVDFGPRSLPAFSWAAHMAAEFQARLTLVHALPDLGSISSSQLVHELAVLLARNARDQMQELQGSAGAEAEVFVETGAPAEIVQRAAQQYAADLVVIGRHEKAGNAGRLRSNVYAIVRESPCPVLSV